MDTNYSVITKQPTFTIITSAKWYTRLYYIITNPFTYLFTGIVRY